MSAVNVHLISRNVNGILLLDKPKNMSSSFVLKKIKKLFNANKAGYIGTLDFLATGMLPICFGEFTKFSKYLSNADKRYRVLARLGESTNTFDAHGVIVRISAVQFFSDKLEECLELFRGELSQIPPMFSSVKYCGIPLYKYARRGISVPRKSRIVYVYSVSLVEKKLNLIVLDIHCSKGTYIRSIINDFGECLGCGAHVLELRRLTVGKYIADSMITLMKIENIIYDNSLYGEDMLNTLDSLLIYDF